MLALYEVEVEKKGSTGAAAPAAEPAAAPAAAPAAKPAAGAGSVKVTTGTAGKVWKLVAKPGDSLASGDTILILEAMKMEIPVVAPQDGTLADISVSEGEEVKAGQTVASMK